ncbi:MAG: hypothetical protein ACJ8J0_23815 [Longimicrobiaceae bacterium]
MRLLPILATAFIAALPGREEASAQQVRATVQASATVVETPRVRMDAAAAAFAELRGGVRLTVPLRVSGAGSPSVAVASAAAGTDCQAVPPANLGARGEAGAAPSLRCFVPRGPAPAGGVTEIPVTLVIVPAT